MSDSENIFETECRELLQEMEQSLLKLDGDLSNQELINSVFRAAHTIKGSSGIFGYKKIVEFTHEVESVLDTAREGKLLVTQKLLSELLVCRDIMEALVNEAISSNEKIDLALEAKGKEMSAQLRTYLHQDTLEAETAKSGIKADVESLDDINDFPINWSINIKFGKDVFRNGMDPLSFVYFLETLGTINKVIANFSEIPGINEMDTEDCYLTLSIEIKSSAEKQELENVFEFVIDECALEIVAINDAAESSQSKQNSENNLLADCEQQAPIKESGNPSNSDIHEPGVKHQNLSEETIRVNAAKLGELIDLVGELVISSATTSLLGHRSSDPELIEAMENMARLVENIRDTGLGLRMVPIGETFNRYRRVVRDLCSTLGKDIQLVISGADKELDKTIIEKIRDPLMHLVRNAIDHGIELPLERQEKNKPAQGTLKLNAYHDSGSIVIEIEDDGAGLSKEKIRNKAVKMALITRDQELSDQELYRLIFAPGFSTASEVTDISGRGVGMDVAFRNIKELRGVIDVASWPGKGTLITIRLPLTLAIIDGFLVRIGTNCYVIPLDIVDECIEHPGNNEDSKEENYVNYRGKVLPFIYLRELFKEEKNVTSRGNIVVVRSGTQKAGLVVDELLGEHQTVIKPLGRIFQNLPYFSGATILGNGDVATILDVPALFKKMQSTKQASPRHHLEVKTQDLTHNVIH